MRDVVVVGESMGEVFGSAVAAVVGGEEEAVWWSTHWLDAVEGGHLDAL